MKKQTMETTVGIFVVAGLLCIGYMTVRLGDVSFLGDPYSSFFARFGSVSGLRVGSPVEIFDFEELSRRTLVKNWEKLSPSQQNEFVQLYRELLENAYMDRILSYSNEKVLYVEEKMPEKGKAEVKTRMTSQTGEIPIDYWLIQKAGAWKVYDVVIEGVSLTKNYRAQFRESLLKKSPAEMLQSLRKKVGKE